MLPTVLALLTALLTSPANATVGREVFCNTGPDFGRLPATRVLTPGEDKIRDGSTHVVVQARGGQDKVEMRDVEAVSPADRIACGGASNDQLFGCCFLYGNQGDDVLIGSHLARGGRGDDDMFTQNDHASAFGGPGEDIIRVGGRYALYHQGTDHIYGGGGNDYYLSVLDGFPGDEVFGGAGDAVCVPDLGDHGHQCEEIQVIEE
jgi:Ca2+-binding RTX toxin-like protein